MKFNAEWFLQQLQVSRIEENEFEALPGQKNAENKETLLHIMFHIGKDSFDQVKLFCLFDLFKIKTNLNEMGL